MSKTQKRASAPGQHIEGRRFQCIQGELGREAANLRAIAAELNIGLDSMVFVDDNPAERSLVVDQLARSGDAGHRLRCTRFAEMLEAEHYFETAQVVQDDLSRVTLLQIECAAERCKQSGLSDYGEFLASLR